MTRHNRTEEAKALLTDVEAWCLRTQTPETAIGHALFRHPGFVGLLRLRLQLSEEKEHAANAATEAAKYGLIAHAMSFGEAIGCRYRPISISAWRRHFIGSMPRGTKSPDLKAMAMRRCRELGFDPIKHDAAEALGILDYQLSVEGIVAPWRQANILQEQLLPIRGRV